MHDDDIQLIESVPCPDGTILHRVRLVPLNLERLYRYNPSSGNYAIDGPERSIRVGGHDMTSILGKRVREFLESRREAPDA